LKAHIESLLTEAVQTLKQTGQLPHDLDVRIQVADTKDKAHALYWMRMMKRPKIAG
jgi:arginyl-tRNA synthetase